MAVLLVTGAAVLVLATAVAATAIAATQEAAKPQGEGPLVLDLSNAWQLIDKGGTIALAVLIVVAFMRGWIVARWQYDKLEKTCDRMTEIALRGTELAERGVSVAEKKAGQ